MIQPSSTRDRTRVDRAITPANVLAIIVALVALVWSAPVEAGERSSSVRVRNETGKTITVYWVAAGCAGVSGIKKKQRWLKVVSSIVGRGGHQMYVCASKKIANKKYADYTFPGGTSNFRVSADCADTVLGEDSRVPYAWILGPANSKYQTYSVSKGDHRAFTGKTKCRPSTPMLKSSRIQLFDNINFCLHNYNNRVASGNKVRLWYCASRLGQHQGWKFAGNKIKLKKNPRYCLTASSSKIKNGVKVSLSTCTASKNSRQLWALVGKRIRFGGNPAYCLHNWSGNHREGNKLGLWKCKSSLDKHQQWMWSGR